MPLLRSPSRRELPEGDKDAGLTGQAFSHEGAGELADFVHTNVPRLPSFAWNDGPFAVFAENEVDVAIGVCLVARLRHSVAIPTENLAYEPLELLGSQETKVGRPSLSQPVAAGAPLGPVDL